MANVHQTTTYPIIPCASLPQCSIHNGRQRWWFVQQSQNWWLGPVQRIALRWYSTEVNSDHWTLNVAHNHAHITSGFEQNLYILYNPGSHLPDIIETRKCSQYYQQTKVIQLVCRKFFYNNNISFIYMRNDMLVSEEKCFTNKTRSQTVARIADRTASQHLRGSRDVIGHVTVW